MSKRFTSNASPAQSLTHATCHPSVQIAIDNAQMTKEVLRRVTVQKDLELQLLREEGDRKERALALLERAGMENLDQ